MAEPQTWDLAVFKTFNHGVAGELRKMGMHEGTGSADGAFSGSLTAESMTAVVEQWRTMGLDESSIVLDVGSEYCKQLLSFARLPIRCSLGLEFYPLFLLGGTGNISAMLRKDSPRQWAPITNVFGDATRMRTFDPCTHVYCYTATESVRAGVLRAAARSPTVRAVSVCFPGLLMSQRFPSISVKSSGHSYRLETLDFTTPGLRETVLANVAAPEPDGRLYETPFPHYVREAIRNQDAALRELWRLANRTCDVNVDETTHATWTVRATSPVRRLRVASSSSEESAAPAASSTPAAHRRPRIVDTSSDDDTEPLHEDIEAPATGAKYIEFDAWWSTQNVETAEANLAPDTLVAPGQTRAVYGRSLPKLVRHILAHCPLGPGSTFVDVGSGVGAVVFMVAAVTGARSYGLEIMPDRHRVALDLRLTLSSRFPGAAVFLQMGDFTVNTAFLSWISNADLIFANNAADIFGPRFGIAGKPTLDQSLVSLFAKHARVGASLVLLHDVVELKTPPLSLALARAEFDAGADTTSWRAASTKWYRYTKISNDWTCSICGKTHDLTVTSCCVKSYGLRGKRGA